MEEITLDCDCASLLYGDDMCIDGTIYSYCDYEYCGGVCEPDGLCHCSCHDET